MTEVVGNVVIDRDTDHDYEIPKYPVFCSCGVGVLLEHHWSGDQGRFSCDCGRKIAEKVDNDK